jgi:RNA polymerase sigma-70 factor (ECF subfamily)
VHHQEDHQLVQKLINKDSVAFKAFFDTYFPRLYRFCYGRMGELGCEDVGQERQNKAVKGLESYRGEASLLTWLCQICRTETVNW